MMMSPYPVFLNNSSSLHEFLYIVQFAILFHISVWKFIHIIFTRVILESR